MLKTDMMRHYLIKLALRVVLFVSVFVLYLRHKARLMEFMVQPIRYGITLVHVIWLIFMIIMLIHLFPGDTLSMALRKSRQQQYVEEPGYSELELLRFIQEQNSKAWTVMLCWLCFNGMFGLLYLFHVIDESDLLMLTVFYFLCDYICILFFCPFQSNIMKNKCCVNCRIYDWGHFMMFTPMLFIRNFYSWTLFFTSCVVLIHWELIYAKHPERFWEGSNRTLQCQHCQDKTCQIKRRLRGRRGNLK